MTSIQRNWKRRKTMEGRHSFAELRACTSPEARTSAESEANRLDMEMDLAEVRRALKLSPEEIGRLLHVANFVARSDMSEFEWTLVDTETTGLHPPIYIVELAAQRMMDWEPRGDYFRIFLIHGVDIPERYFALQKARFDRAMQAVDDALDELDLRDIPALVQLLAEYDRYEGLSARLSGRAEPHAAVGADLPRMAPKRLISAESKSPSTSPRGWPSRRSRPDPVDAWALG